MIDLLTHVDIVEVRPDNVGVDGLVIKRRHDFADAGKTAVLVKQ